MEIEVAKVKKLYEAIIKTMAFFDLFDYPLTLYEVWQWGLWPEKISIAAVEKLLDGKELNNRIENKNGFYFLAGREKIITARLKRYNYAIRKFKRLKLVARLFKIIPWIKLIALGNIIGANNLKDKSDIDVFIVAEKRRVWLTRFFCASLMAGLNLRPRPGRERDKICLNFYVSEDNLNLSDLMLSQEPKESGFGRPEPGSLPRDIYFIYWLACLMPVYDRDNTYQKLIEANRWLKKALPGWRPVMPERRLTASAFRPRLYGEVIDLFIGGLEPEIKKFQLKKLPPDKKTIMNKDTRVVAGSSIIKLHNKDRRREYAIKWRERIERLENREFKTESEHILALASAL